MRHFLIALLSLSMAACASFNPMAPTAMTYAAELVSAVEITPEQFVPAPEPVIESPQLSGIDRWLTSDEGQYILGRHDAFEPTYIATNVSPLNPAELNCMALNMYFEARGEGERGMAAVGYIVLNRKADPKWPPKTVCGIVYQGAKDAQGRPVRNRCQFSWYCDGLPDRIHDQAMFAKAMEVAERVMRRDIANPVGKSTHYHARRVTPSWSRRLVYHASIGAHRFYY